MYEGYNPGDEPVDDGEFDSVVGHSAPSARVPFFFNNIRFDLTPANTTVRMFFGENLVDYSRVVVYLDDGSAAPFKPEDKFMQTLVRKGFPVELPEEPDETDQEFMDEYMRVWTEDAAGELGLDT